MDRDEIFEDEDVERLVQVLYVLAQRTKGFIQIHDVELVAVPSIHDISIIFTRDPGDRSTNIYVKKEDDRWM